MKIYDFKDQVWQGQPWDDSIDHLKERPSEAVRQNIFALAKNSMPSPKRSSLKLIWWNTFALVAASIVISLVVYSNMNTKSNAALTAFVDDNPQLCAQAINDFDQSNFNVDNFEHELANTSGELAIMDVDIDFYCSTM